MATAQLARCASSFVRTCPIHRLCLRSRSFSSSALLTKSAIVTGSARGIGKAIAVRLAQDGYDVCINDVPANHSSAEEVASHIRSLGRKSCVAIADVSDLPQVESMVQASVKQLGPLDTMIANAGIVQVKPLLDLTPEDFHRMYSINVFGVQNCFVTAARQIISQGTASASEPGKLIAAASVAAFRPTRLISHYSSTKWAVRGLCHGYAVELAEHNITVNAYAPGIVGTDMWDQIDAEMSKERGVEKGEVIRRASRELITLGRTSVPEDVAKLVSYLAGRDSDYVTGQTMVVDGGITFT